MPATRLISFILGVLALAAICANAQSRLSDKDIENLMGNLSDGQPKG
jgi:hypothetical protein